MLYEMVSPLYQALKEIVSSVISSSGSSASSTMFIEEWSDVVLETSLVIAEFAVVEGKFADPSCVSSPSESISVSNGAPPSLSSSVLLAYSSAVDVVESAVSGFGEESMRMDCPSFLLL